MRKFLPKILLAVVVLISCGISTSYADTHWVNLAGSNQPPYTSYASGAHKIQDAIDAGLPGDTIRVAAGHYDSDTTVMVWDSLTLVGAGMDSTVVYAENDDGYYIFVMTGDGVPGGGTTVEGFTIQGFNSSAINRPKQGGVYIYGKMSSTNRVTGNRFYYCSIAVRVDNANTIVADNVFDSNYVAILFSSGGPFDIHDNTIICSPIGDNQFVEAGIVSVGFNYGPARIHDNRIFTFNGVGVSLINIQDSIYFYNNIIVTGGSVGSTGLLMWCDGTTGIVENNTIIRKVHNPDKQALAKFMLEDGSEFFIENNIFQAVNGTVELVHGWTDGGSWRFAYNDLWGMDYDGLACEGQCNLDSIGNLYKYPMLTTDSAYQLQRGSPLIDAGDPSVFDLDGTRSDIGWTGGSGGQVYLYPEEPPQRPDTLIGEGDGEAVFLSWYSNTEADLGEYRLYRDSYSGFSPSLLNFLAVLSLEDTSYLDPITDISGDLYYRLTAIDTAGLESPPSNEVAVISTGILEDGEAEQHVPRIPSITGNYPNPFNSSTMIEYYIPDIGARPTMVQLNIYDILGKKVTTLVGEHKYPGHHQARWDGHRDDGRTASSGVYFARLHIWGHEFKSSAKLILQK